MIFYIYRDLVYEVCHFHFTLTFQATSLPHCPSHAHSAVHCRAAFTQLQLLEHPFLHQQQPSSRQHFAASGRVVQSGWYLLPSNIHPQLRGSGSTGWTSRVWPHICTPWYTACLTCYSNAAWEGGMFSIDLPFFVKRCFWASFTWNKQKFTCCHKYSSLYKMH